MNQVLTIKDPFGTATTGKLGMWLFLVMDAITFATILLGGVYFRLANEANYVSRKYHPDWICKYGHINRIQYNIFHFRKEISNQ